MSNEASPCESIALQNTLRKARAGMSDDNKVCFAVAGLCVLCFAAGCVAATQLLKSSIDYQWQKDAVSHGAAEWVVDENTGEVEWSWLTETIESEGGDE